MEYILMHKDIPVCLIEISSEGTMSTKQRILSNINHFPIGGKMNNSKFSEWWKRRATPENRDGLQKALEKNGYQSIDAALIDSLALSVSDCYWVKPRGSKLRWNVVNLYKHGFIDSIGETEFNSSFKINNKKKQYRIATSSGELKKKWCIDKEGHRVLIKGNVGISFQQSLNEIFISKIHHDLNPKDCLIYELIEIDVDGGRKILGCQSKNFCNEDIEFVSAWELVQSSKKKGNDNYFSIFKKACLGMGMDENYFHQYMDYLILTDYLFTNIDRHLNNFGILRNPNTLELISFSPIYDSGNSMFYNIPYEELKKVDFKKIKTSSFYEKEEKMLRLIKNKNCIDLSKIKPDFSIYKKDIKENQRRYSLIKKLFEQKMLAIKKFQNNHK